MQMCCGRSGTLISITHFSGYNFNLHCMVHCIWELIKVAYDLQVCKKIDTDEQMSVSLSVTYKKHKGPKTVPS